MDYKQAKKRVEALKGYYIHLAVYIIFSTMFYLIDLFGGGGWWFYWPVFAWGAAVAIHTFTLLFEIGPFGAEWEERKIKELMHKA